MYIKIIEGGLPTSAFYSVKLCINLEAEKFVHMVSIENLVLMILTKTPNLRASIRLFRWFTSWDPS